MTLPSMILDHILQNSTNFYVQVWGLPIHIRSNSPQALEGLTRENILFLESNQPVLGREYVEIIHFEYASPEQVPMAIRPIIMQSDPKLFIENTTDELVLFTSTARGYDSLRSLLLRTIILHFLKRGFHFLHGSVVTKGENSMVFLGDKSSGKTTFTLALVEKYGWKMVSDDLVMLGVENGRPVAYALQNSVNLDSNCESIERFVEDVWARQNNLECWDPSVKEKKRRYVPVESMAEKTVLRHIIFPTVHPLAKNSVIEEINYDGLLKLLSLNYYKAAVLPGFRSGEQGILNEGDVLEALHLCNNHLFLGGLDLKLNLQSLLSIL